MMQKLLERARSEAGFTLIELMIVIVILGVLAGIVIFAVGGITDNGNLAACKSDLKTVTVAVEAYQAKHGVGSYPANLDPTLTTGSDRFLRAQAGLTGNTLTNTSGGYVITYTPATGDVTSNMAGC
jgi:prepilin-type N-terminal cleavage/methylation domain-containing protein